MRVCVSDCVRDCVRAPSIMLTDSYLLSLSACLSVCLSVIFGLAFVDKISPPPPPVLMDCEGAFEKLDSHWLALN